MRNILIATIAGLAVAFAGSVTPSAEARPWGRAYRNLNQSQRQFNRGFNRGYNRAYRGYYAPRRYYYPRYGYRNFGYRNYGYRGYGWGGRRGGIYFSF